MDMDDGMDNQKWILLCAALGCAKRIQIDMASITAR